MDISDPGRAESGVVIDIRRPSKQVVPLVLASPHSGAGYSPEFLASSRLDPLTLRRSEDSFVDEIFAAAPDLGAPLIAARFPRAYLDVNREPWELDPAMFADPLPNYVNIRSPRVRMGLGTIARVVASGEEIYARKLRFAEARERVETLYYPYHHALRQQTLDTEAAFGGYLLIDCHSMPSAASEAGGHDPADIVLGDCHGTACAPYIVEAARSFLSRRNFVVALNAPYAGGFTTAHYGTPRRGRHALQIEINRALYMDERRCRRKPGLADLAAEMTLLVAHLAGAMSDRLGEAPRAAAE
jgi:N-formylglutamate amidohydrolase